MEKMIIRRNPTKHHAYTHIMIDFSCLLLRPICESLSAAFLFMSKKAYPVQMTHKLLT